MDTAGVFTMAQTELNGMNRPFRVLHIGSPNGLFGAERWILALVKYLNPAEFHSIVATFEEPSSEEPPVLTEARKLGVDTHRFDSTGSFNLSDVKNLRRYLKHERVDIVHTHWYQPDVLAAFASFGLSNTKFVTTPHGWNVNEGPKVKIYEALDRLAFCRFDAVVPLSSGIYKELDKLFWLSHKLYLIQNGVDVGEIDQVGVKCVIEPVNQPFVIGYIGQLIPRKRLDLILKAVSALSHEMDIKAQFIGTGSEQEALEKEAADLGISGQVEFLGYREDRLGLLREFDVFVLPSELEGIPRCIMEAMAMGVPCAVSRIPGCVDLIEDGVTGISFEVNDLSAATEAIGRLLRDRELRQRIVKSARHKIETTFSSEYMAHQYADLYQQL